MTKRRTQIDFRKTLTRLVSLSAFYASIAYLGISDIQSAYDPEARVIGLLGPSFISFLMLVCVAFIFDKTFRQFLENRYFFACSTLLLFYTVVGLWQGNERYFLIADLVVWVWPLGGLALFRLMLKAKMPALHLLALICIATLVMHICQSVTIEIRQFTEKIGDVRVSSFSLFNTSNLLLVPSSIGLGIWMRKGLIGALILLVLIGIHFYEIVLLSATRSSAVVILVVFLLSLIGLSYKVKNGVITNTKSFSTLWILVSVMVVSVGLFFPTLINMLLESSVISSRINEGDTGWLRVLELIDALEQMNDWQFIFGGGLGFAFDSIFGYRVHRLHLGILTFLLKGGIILLLPVMILVYFSLPKFFATAWLRPAALDLKVRSAALVVLPGIFGWIILLTISGGYILHASLGAGFGLGAFLHIKDEGLSKFLPS